MLEYGVRHTIAPGIFITLQNAGHILGSATIKIEAEGKTVVVSGDLGNFPAPIIRPTEPMPKADYCLIESTYGNRTHEGFARRREDLELERRVTQYPAVKLVDERHRLAQREGQCKSDAFAHPA